MPVQCVRHVVVMVAHMEQGAAFLLFPVQVHIPAGVHAGASAGAGVRYTDVRTVKAGQFSHRIHIGLLQQPQQGLGFFVVFKGHVQVPNALLHPKGAGIVAFTLAEYACEGGRNDARFMQGSAEKGDVLLQDRLLKLNAGGGDHKGRPASVLAFHETVFVQDHRSDEIGVRFPNAYRRIAEANTAGIQGIKNVMAKVDLSFPDSTAIFRQYFTKYTVDGVMGFFDCGVLIFCHSIVLSFLLLYDHAAGRSPPCDRILFCCSYRICSPPPGSWEHHRFAVTNGGDRAAPGTFRLTAPAVRASLTWRPYRMISSGPGRGG